MCCLVVAMICCFCLYLKLVLKFALWLDGYVIIWLYIFKKIDCMLHTLYMLFNVTFTWLCNMPYIWLCNSSDTWFFF